jgi:membrane protein DedA with SNARE-associated domain
MPYAQFGLYNVLGALLWTGVCTGAPPLPPGVLANGM